MSYVLEEAVTQQYLDSIACMKAKLGEEIIMHIGNLKKIGQLKRSVTDELAHKILFSFRIQVNEKSDEFINFRNSSCGNLSFGFG